MANWYRYSLLASGGVTVGAALAMFLVGEPTNAESSFVEAQELPPKVIWVKVVRPLPMPSPEEPGGIAFSVPGNCPSSG